MAKRKFDGVVEAVRYQSNGSVEWVRAYLRRGSIFSDRVLVDRETLIRQLKEGKRFVAGKRIPQMAGTFEVSQPLHLLQSNSKEILVTGDTQSEGDRLEGVPVV